jgi:hypothetical protein
MPRPLTHGIRAVTISAIMMVSPPIHVTAPPQCTSVIGSGPQV